MRIVVPAYQTEHVLDLLQNLPSATNVILLERAARKPEGDVILCDVAREEASLDVGGWLGPPGPNDSPSSNVTKGTPGQHEVARPLRR